MSRPVSRLAPAFLVAWVALAGALFVLAEPPPEPPPVGPEDQAIRDRMADWAVRDAEQWTEQEGDLNLDWAKAKGHLAIVIDDTGRELDMFEELLDLRFALTFSVLPNSVYAAGVQQRLQVDDRRPREILMHLPMEPLDTKAMRLDLEAGEIYLLASDDPDQLRAKTLAALDRVPYAVGVNNHMGSKLSADPRAMAAIMPSLHERGVFFLDSRTVPTTVAAEQAELASVPALSRHLFLDHDPTPKAIRAALWQAAERSRSEPTVTIAHPSPALVEILREELPRLHEQGVGVYPLSRMLAEPAQRRLGDAAARNETHTGSLTVLARRK